MAQQGGHMVVAVPNIFTKEWLEKKYHKDIKAALDRMNAGIQSIEYKVSSKGLGADIQAPLAQDPILASPKAEPIISTAPAPCLNARYTFENFVVGSSNELAYAAAQAVASNPGTKYNPLFIYGGVGLGKTHLMQAVGNAILKRDPNKKVEYVTSEEFTSEFIASVSRKKTKPFADKFRSLDVLIVDDIQFLGNKEKTQEEFFHTFNTLYQANKQIVMSSDKPPKTIPHLEERLRSRFEWGMAADIQAPDLETRAAILQRKADSHEVDLPMEVIDYLARHFQHNIRELEGALTQFIAFCELRGIEPSITAATGLLGEQVASSSRRKIATPRFIIEKTAAFFEIQPGDITGAKRDKDIVVPRQIAMYLMRHELSLSFPKIASMVGRRDHTTAMHSVSKIEKQLEVDQELRTNISQLKNRVSSRTT